MTMWKAIGSYWLYRSNVRLLFALLTFAFTTRRTFYLKSESYNSQSKNGFIQVLIFMFKMLQNSSTSIINSKQFSGVKPQDPPLKGRVERIRAEERGLCHCYGIWTPLLKLPQRRCDYKHLWSGMLFTTQIRCQISRFCCHEVFRTSSIAVMNDCRNTFVFLYPANWQKLERPNL